MMEQRKTSNYTCSETYYMPSHTELKQYTMYVRHLEQGMKMSDHLLTNSVIFSVDTPVVINIKP